MKHIGYHEHTLTLIANVVTYLESTQDRSRQEIILYIA